MTSFVSISIDEEYEQYALPLLLQRLRDRGLYPSTNYQKKTFNAKDIEHTHMMNGCDVFIGMMTIGGPKHEKVLAEYNYALSKNREAILLTESEVELPLEVEKSGNVLYFDRDAPQIAIEKIENNIRQIGEEVSRHPDYKGSLIWLLCGPALIATIKFLSLDEIKAERNAALGVLA